MSPLDTSYRDRRKNDRLRDPEYKIEYERATREIAQVDAIMRELDERRIKLGMSKAELARHIGKESSSVRRLFTSHSNPELKTVAAIADVLDTEIVVRPRKVTRTRTRRAGGAAA